MKILFVTHQSGHFQPFGIMMLSAVLKQAGHTTGLVPLSEHMIKRALRKDSWDILAFNVSTPSYRKALTICRNIKRGSNIYTIFGGPHPTFSPEIIEEESIDAVCRGEGELALLEFIEKKQKGESLANIKNWWLKENGTIFRNDVRMLVEDLDTLPYADRKIAEGFNYFTSKRQEVLISRGCLFDCSYCFNEKYAQLYSSKGKRIRSRSIENIFGELEQIRSKYLPDSIVIFDDLFPISEEWNKEFCERYSREINIPFSVESRPGYLTERMVKDLKKAGCTFILLGIETANEQLRYEILNRHMKNTVIDDCCSMIHSYGIGIAAFILCGIPNSTIQDDIDTLEYARKLRIDLPLVNACQPYPKTRMFEQAVEKGILDPHYRITESDLFSCRRSPFSFPLKLQNREVYNLVCLYGLWLNPKLPISLLRILIKLPFGHLYLFILKFWWGFRPRGSSISIKNNMVRIVTANVVNLCRYILWKC